MTSAAYMIDRNGEGAHRVTALVDDGNGPWYYTATFYGYTRREIIPAYRRQLAANGWRVVR